jgi:hypothetical protein
MYLGTGQGVEATVMAVVCPDCNSIRWASSVPDWCMMCKGLPPKADESISPTARKKRERPNDQLYYNAINRRADRDSS